MSRERAKQIVDEFNERFPVGTPVVIRKYRRPIETVVSSPARVLGISSAVGYFRGMLGGHSIYYPEGGTPRVESRANS